jgi:phosphoglycerate dehydrogenase-like enzyme
MKAIFCLDAASYDLIYGPDERAAIAEQADLVSPQIDAQALYENPSLLSEVEAIFSGWGGPLLSEEILRHAPHLKVVFYGAGSVKYMLSEAFWKQGIQITSAYAANAVPVVEYCLGQILFGLKSGWQQVLRCREEKTFTRLPMAGGYGSTVGLVSLGMIGRMLAERLKTFDLKIVAYDPFVQSYPGVEMVSPERLFSESDVVSLHTPWLKETEGLIGGDLLARMKPYTTFINSSRGAVLREAELIAVLQSRPDLTAVLDVTYPEPPEPDSPLYTLPNVILTPHIAGSVGEECRRMGHLMVEELSRFLAGQEMKYRLTREKVALMA